MELEGKLDVIRVDLQPNEQYKSVSRPLVANIVNECFILRWFLLGIDQK